MTRILVAEAHGGRAVMESVEGQGTTVRVTLPAPAVAPAAEATDAGQTPGLGTASNL